MTAPESFGHWHSADDADAMIRTVRWLSRGGLRITGRIHGLQMARVLAARQEWQRLTKRETL